ncbi:MAG: pyridoxamine 5'-phosphate oxidase family protein [Candidatus Abyssobacteria bacterium SURF_5]|uniref:Pyridoxamine 5'-phosphate oxidase family protein n=1 Tax=Abyssobacteria bacterium (strain SURF_5) TaxID=2093360 RepID=A0A3A4NVB5_ABYX5|nr:MAG: pyridoxamine 5'-phosphate oxidase family protein [Candidatus Abyssubacteria bacterium SURF_5]
MNLKEYFESKQGRGVLATSDSEGRVDAAVYARPHVLDGDTIAFIMADRLTHQNLQSNPRAAYLFMEDGDHYVGKRFFLTKTKEVKNAKEIDAIRRRSYEELKDEDEFLVYFRIDKTLPLIGAGEG